MKKRIWIIKKYRTRAIISRGLYIFFTPFSKTISLILRRFFSENSALMYGLYPRAAYDGALTVVKICYRMWEVPSQPFYKTSILNDRKKMQANPNIKGHFLLLNLFWWAKKCLNKYVFKKDFDPNVVSCHGCSAIPQGTWQI